MVGYNGGGEAAREKRSLGNTLVGEIFILLEGHTELILPVLLGALECVLKGGKGRVLILESSLQIHAPKSQIKLLKFTSPRSYTYQKQ